MSQKMHIDRIMENFKKLVDTTKRVSATGLVTFSGICPRLDNNYAVGRGKELNSRIKELAVTEGCCFVGHEGTFLCKNGEINDALLLVDGLHLSAADSKRMLNNLSLSSHTTVSLGRKIPAKLRAGPQRNSHEAGNAQDAQVAARPLEDGKVLIMPRNLPTKARTHALNRDHGMTEGIPRKIAQLRDKLIGQ